MSRRDRKNMLEICLLGTGGMMPLPNRWLTALTLRYKGRLLLIDCGEGTQITMKLLGWSFKSIDYIFFTHYHGDHISGLPGLLLTMGNSDRVEPLTLIGPPGLEKVVKSLLVIAPELPFEIRYIELQGKADQEEAFGDFFVRPFPLKHGIPCFGYSVEIKRTPKFLPEKAELLGLPKQLWGKLQYGEKVEWQGKFYTPDMVLGEKRKGIKVSYCTDSRPVPAIIEGAKGADLFICEGMYGDDEKIHKAREYKHMTFSEAAALAKKANVKELWLTHFSPSLVAPKEYIHEAKNIFPNAYVGVDRKIKTLMFQE